MLETKIIVILITVIATAIIIPVVLFVHFCPSGTLYDSILGQCITGSEGWKITGYFTPVETDYPNDTSVSVYVRGIKADGSFDYMENNTKYYLKEFKSTFVNEINIQGSGKTSENKILQTWLGDFIHPNGTKTRFYHYEPCAKTSSGICLDLLADSLDAPMVMVAVSNGTTDLEAGVIAHGTLFHIPDIPYPWNSKTFWAVDTGEWHDKHVDIYTGYGLQARAEAERITKLPPDSSGTVLVIGFKSTNGTHSVSSNPLP
ncbi:MAG TPA: hypothetical protein VET47_00010 [Candidatus Limnocylindrales bacterium]|nr:hypothetical protein [Candidatus Limnocylindrales bacterium]